MKLCDAANPEIIIPLAKRLAARVRRLTPGPVRKTLRRVPGMVAQAGEALENSRVGPRVRNWISKEEPIA